MAVTLNHFTIALATGAVVGLLNVVPMIARQSAFRSCLSAFCTYLFAAVIVFYSDLPYLPWWADGMVVTLMMVIPVLLTLTGKERRVVSVMLLDALLLGLVISLSERFLG